MIARFVLSFSISISCALVSVPITAHAQSAARQLDYRAPAECPDAARFSDEVAARLGYLPFGPTGERTEVRILRDDTGPAVELVGTLTVGSEAARAFRSGDCDDLVDTMAAALAVALDASSAPEPEPAPAQAPPAEESGRVRVRVTAPDGRPLTLHRVTGHQTATIATSRGVAYGFGESFEDICEAPCEVELDAGQYELAVSMPGRSPVSASGRYRLESDSTIAIDYADNVDLRAAGWITWWGGLAAGLPVALGALALPNDPANGCNSPLCGPDSGAAYAMVIGGTILAGASLLVGIALTCIFDGAAVDVAPMPQQ